MGSIRWDDTALGHVIGKAPQVQQAVSEATGRIHAKANAMGRGYAPRPYHKNHERALTQGDPASYMQDVSELQHAVVGIVGTDNSASRVDNAEHNTLLKAIG